MPNLISNHAEIKNIVSEKRYSYTNQILNMLLLITVFYAAYWYYLGAKQVAIFCLVNLLVFSVIYYLFKKRKNDNIIVEFILFQCIFYVFGIAVWIYEFAPVILGYYLLLPIGAILLKNFRLAKKVGALCFISILCIPYLSSKYHIVISYQNQQILSFIQIISILSILMLLLYLLSNYYNILISNLEERSIKLEKTQNYKNKFFASISHEIRTPMNAIKGISSILLNNNTFSNNEKELILNLNNSSNHLLSIINDLLDLSKIEENKLSIHESNTNIRDVIIKAIKIVRYNAEEKELILTCNIDENVPLIIKGDAIRLTQVILNLLSNAIKFTNKGFVKLTCEIDSNSDLKIAIEDSGIGITSKDKSEIFKSYFQSKDINSLNSGGTGLGLAISKSLINLMGGKLDFTSDFQKGSLFYFTIPLKLGNLEEFNINHTNNLATSQINNIKILAVDDNLLNLVVLKKLIQESIPNVKIITTESGEKALDIINNDNDFNLILLDIQMPILDGYDVAKLIRTSSNDKIKNIPIIAVTANVCLEVEEKCNQFGIQDLIGKPFEIEMLVQKINNIFNLSSSVKK